MKVHEYNAMLNEARLPVLEETRAYNTDGRRAHNSPGIIFEFFRDNVKLDRHAEERAYCLAMNAQFKPIGVFEVGHGTINQCIVDIRGMFQKMLMLGACAFSLVHNHPSGIESPSREDNAVTERVKEAARVLSIDFVDHIIIADCSYYSYKYEGVL